VDSGPEEVDSGPEEVDSGPEEVDSGPEEVDSGWEEVEDSEPEELEEEQDIRERKRERAREILNPDKSEEPSVPTEEREEGESLYIIGPGDQVVRVQRVES